MKNPIELTFEQTVTDEGLRRILRLHGTQPTAREIHFDLLGESERPMPAVLDGAVMAKIHYLMMQGRPLRVRGAMSRNALANLHEFQSAWQLWRPERYRRVEIEPDRVVDIARTPSEPRTIAAFSGGVDGAFTALRHARKDLGNASHRLTDVMLVHGFDIPVGRRESFAKAVERVRPLPDELGLNVRLLRTNLRCDADQNWEDSHFAQLSACLHQFSGEFTFALAGSGSPYNRMSIPWGATPATDYLLSGDLLQIRPDGYACSRMDKVAALASHPTAVRTLRVCWQGPDPDRNCGQCEKCMRTRLGLRAAGLENPACFDTPMDIQAISRIRIANHVQHEELRAIVTYARARDLQGEWLERLDRRLRLNPLRKFLGRPWRWLRNR